MRYSTLLLLAGLAAGCRSETTRSSTNSVDNNPPAAAVDASPRSDTARDGMVHEEAPQPAAAPAKAWLLVPGRSAGNTALGEDAEKVYKLLGPADDGDAAMQKAVAVWYSNHNPKGHSTAIYTERAPGARENPPALVRQIWVTSPSFRTAEEVGPGSSRQEIEKVFHLTKGETYQDAGQTYTIYEGTGGIAFEMNRRDQCSAVIIHRPGDTGGSTYLKFRFH